jgi:hypothetical protein
MSVKTQYHTILETLKILDDPDADIASCIDTLCDCVDKPQVLKDMLSCRYGNDKMMAMTHYMSKAYLDRSSEVVIRRGLNRITEVTYGD